VKLSCSENQKASVRNGSRMKLLPGRLSSQVKILTVSKVLFKYIYWKFGRSSSFQINYQPHNFDLLKSEIYEALCSVINKFPLQFVTYYGMAHIHG
jgi:hypothetical protein